MAIVTDLRDERFDDDARALLSDEPGSISYVADQGDPTTSRARRRRLDLTPRRLALLTVTWAAVTLAVPLLVLYGFGPLFEQRSQQSLLRRYRTDIRHAAADADTPFGVVAPTLAATSGSPVGIVEAGRMRVQQVVVEGVGPEQTRQGPGHVPGTAGLGQPGNAAVVGRAAGFGGSFGSLDVLRRGDAIVVTTTQGRSVYRVSQVRKVEVSGPAAATSRSGGAAAPVAGSLAAKMPIDELYAPSNDNRLTLVSSGSWQPWAADRAVVVVATMQGDPFAPTVQNARAATADGRHGDGSSGAPLLLALLAYLAAAVGSVLLYRRFSFRSAYLMSTPALVMFALLLGETMTRVLPAWT